MLSTKHGELDAATGTGWRLALGGAASRLQSFESFQSGNKAYMITCIVYLGVYTCLYIKHLSKIYKCQVHLLCGTTTYTPQAKLISIE